MSAGAGMAGRGRQRGIATLLIILMLGVAVSTSVLLIWHTLRGSQEAQLSVHATTPAQASAWRGLELVRRWLAEVEPTALEAWAAGGTAVPLQFGAAAPLEFSATLRSVEKAGSGYRVTAEVTGRAAEGGTAEARSLLEAVLEVEPAEEEGEAPGGGTTPVVGAIAAVNLYRDLDMTGHIEVLGAENAVFNVQGNATLDTASITGVDTLNATGNVTLGAGIHARNVHANGDVTLRGAASGTQVRARGNAVVSGAAHPVALRVNGNAVFNGGAAGLVEAGGDVLVRGGGVLINTVRAMRDVVWDGFGGGAGSIHANRDVDHAAGNLRTTLRAGRNVRLRGGGPDVVQANGWLQHGAGTSVESATAIGNVTLTQAKAGRVRTRGDTAVSGWGGIDALEGQGNLHVGGWAPVAGTVGGRVTKEQQWNALVRVASVPGFQVPISPVEPITVEEVPELTMAPPRVDAWPLKALANYVFEVGRDGRPVVTVSQVSGIPDGSYRLGIRRFGALRYPDYLCREQDLAGDTCNNPVATICEGFSLFNGCIALRGRTWTVNGNSLARGITWFDGDLRLETGTYANTFIATGSIGTSGAHRALAPNYAGYDVTCRARRPPVSLLPPNPDFANLVPTNLCDTAAGRMRESPLANIVYLAGGYAPGGSGFTGGDITLGAASRADGAVVAGNVLETGGSTVISGSIVSAGQGGGGNVRLSGSTILRLHEGSEEYDPGLLPCEITGCEAAETPVVSGAQAATVLWTRYR